VKRFVSRLAVLMAMLAFAIVTFAVSALTPAFAQGAPAPDFGTPPSGEVPILFNDQHVYSKPDRLKKSRVLAALVRGKTILVPLRSMFEQMGATVSYNASTKTVDVSKPGADVQVAVGKPEVVINGETRPLDVPPEMYKGSIVVPVRVISEGMGAYVQWVADKRLVVVRYLAQPIATPPPPTATPAPPTPSPAPTATPSATPTPTPSKAAVQVYLAGDALFDPKVYNEFSPGNRGGVSEAGRVGATFSINNLAILAEANFVQFRYPHRSATGSPNGPFYSPNVPCGLPDPVNATVLAPFSAPVGDPGCVSVLGPSSGSAYVPSFDARDTDVDGRIGIGIANPKIFIVGSYIDRFTNYGYPRLTGIGGGIEKLSNFEQPIDVYGSILYYPQITGNYTDIFSNPQKLQYRLLKYQAGVTLNVPRTPLFLDFGYLGDSGIAKMNAPTNFTESSLYGGLGLHF
jgi:Copper amine oxidase N-terminal domain